MYLSQILVFAGNNANLTLKFSQKDILAIFQAD